MVFHLQAHHHLSLSLAHSRSQATLHTLLSLSCFSLFPPLERRRKRDSAFFQPFSSRSDISCVVIFLFCEPKKMEFRLWLVCLLLAMAAVAESLPLDYSTIGLGCRPALGECDGFYGGPEMDSEINRRLLAASRRYISYGALKRNTVPCSRRGNSYYNCTRMKKANPYKRGCSAITRCKRSTN